MHCLKYIRIIKTRLACSQKKKPVNTLFISTVLHTFIKTAVVLSAKKFFVKEPPCAGLPKNV